MPITAADLTYPVGEIRAAWLPGEDLAATLTTWIGQAEALVPAEAMEAQADGIRQAHAYVRAYEAITLLLAGQPDTVTLPGLGVTVKDARTWFSAKAKEWKAVLETVFGGVAVVESAPSTPPRASKSTPVTFVL